MHVIPVNKVVDKKRIIGKRGQKIIFNSKSYALILTKMGWATFRAIFSQTHLFTLVGSVEGLYWLPLLCITVFMIADSLGLGSIPFVFVGEFFPSEMRSVMSGLTTGLANLELFLVSNSAEHFSGNFLSSNLGQISIKTTDIHKLI
jgi:hypothetical protein